MFRNDPRDNVTRKEHYNRENEFSCRSIPPPYFFLSFYTRATHFSARNKTQLVLFVAGIRVLAHLGRVCPAETIKGMALKRA